MRSQHFSASRWLVFIPAATLALFGTSAKADASYNVWTCWASNTDNWTMLQPIEHYEQGYYPSWTDCLAWRDGSPDEPYLWSYGIPSPTTIQTTTTTYLETTTSTSSSVPTTEETWVTTTESTTTVPTSTTGVPTTTVPAETTTSSSMVTTTVTTAAPWVPPPTYETTTTSTSTTIVETTTTTVAPSTLPSTTQATVAVTTVPKPSSTTSTTLTTVPEETTTSVASPTTTVVPQAIMSVGVLSFSQAEQVFQNLDVTELDNAEIEAIVEAVQDAPTEVREAFEESVDVFGAGFDDYVPLGSTVPVETRRTLIAVAAGTGLAAVGASRRNN